MDVMVRCAWEPGGEERSVVVVRRVFAIHGFGADVVETLERGKEEGGRC